MSEIHSVLFDNTKWTMTEARYWLKQSKLKPIKRVHITDKYYRYRIHDPRIYKRFITKKITKQGLIFIIGFKK